MHQTRAEFIAFGFLLTGLMSLVVSGISTLRTAGAQEGFVALWLSAWLPSWAVAFPVILVVSPLARRIVAGIFRRGRQ